MIGNLLTLVTALGTYAIGAVALRNLLARRVRVAVARYHDEVRPS